MAISAEKMVEFVFKVCNECGPRLAGSEGERRAGEIIYAEISSFCDEVNKEYFRCRPGGFLDYIWFTVAFYLAGAVSYFLGYPLIAALFMLIAFLIFLFQQCLIYEIVDFAFPEVEEYHIVGKIKPKNDAEKLVILSAHYDSAYEFPLLGKLKTKSVYVIGPAILITLSTMLLSVISLAIFVDPIQKPLLLIGTVLLLFIAKNLRSNKVVLGANDDLAAVAVILEVGKYISVNRPKNTEVWIVAFAGEEHMRGSKRFVEKHYEELKHRNAVMLNLECPSADYFLITTEERMFFAKHSRLAVEYVKKAAKDVDFDIRVGVLPFAGSDAANFSRRGLHAVSVFGLSVSDDSPYFWHTMDDVPENLKPESIFKAAQLVKNFVYVVDS